MLEPLYEYAFKLLTVFFVITNAGGEMGYVWAARTKGHALRYTVGIKEQRRFNIDITLIYIMSLAAIFVFGSIVEMSGYRMLVIYGVLGAFMIGLALGFAYFVERERKLNKKD